ncbi:MAG: OmpA family protein [Nitrosomonas sp.]|nr:OmpA family protein [Nitrosomonas sp.]
MKKMSIPKSLIGAALAPILFSSVITAQAAMQSGVDDEKPLVNKIEAYAVDDRGIVSRNTTGLCWRTGYWTPAMAIPECDPELFKKPEVAVAPPPPPAAPRKVTFSADALFDFDKATLKAEGIRSLDEFASGIQTISYDRIHVDGYADRIGSDDYNKRLSFRRAQAVKAHLVSRGISAEKISIDGKGEADPVTGNTCDGIRVSKQLKQCLAPDRRVEIETFGMQQ